MAKRIARHPKPKKEDPFRRLVVQARAARKSVPKLALPATHATEKFEAQQLEILHKQIVSIRPNPHNTRTHSKRQIRALKRSIENFGFVRPILVDVSGKIVAGHGCWEAAKQLGLTHVPTIALSNLTPAQVRAYLVADNKLAEMSGWDREKLAIELQDLSELKIDLSLTGFEAAELEVLMSDFAPPGMSPDDVVPPVPADRKAFSQLGDIWHLGKHRLACGDSSDPTLVGRLLGGAAPVLMATDPPYAVNYAPGWRHKLGINTSRRTRPILNDDRADWREAWALFPGDVAYVWHAGLHAGTVAASLVEAGFEIRSQIIWNKARFVIGRGDYHWQHEPCWYAVRKGCSGRWNGNRDQSTVWTIAGPSDASPAPKDQVTEHATQKPVECMRRPILNNTSPGDAVYDPFMGSGTTIIAAERTGRAAFGVELDPLYVDVAIKRWQSFTGKDALLGETGLTFDDVASERTHGDSGDRPAGSRPRSFKRNGEKRGRR